MTKLLNHSSKKNPGPDYYILITTIILSLIGLVFIYSASSYTANLKYEDSFYFVKKQALALIFGTIIMILMHYFDYKKFIKYKWVIIIFSFIILALVFTPLGMENYGAKRWINLKFITMQPSELSKFGLVIFIAAYLEGLEKIKFKHLFIVILMTGIMVILIMLEPNMSITMCVVFSVVILLFATGLPIRYFVAIGIPLLIGAVILILAEPYRVARLMAYIDPWASPKGEGYQLIQSLYGLGSGGLFGVGIFNSRQKYLFLPFSESDFILSIIGEEVGFVGLSILIILYMVLVVRGIKIAIEVDDRFSCYMATGITTVIAVQTLLNIAVVSGSIPPTGLPLPYISSGGSSLVCFMTASGLLSSIHAQGTYKPDLA